MNRPTLLYQVPDKFLFSHREAARYVGQSPNTFTKTVESGSIPVFWQRNRKTYKLTDLEDYVSALPEYNYTSESPDERRAIECKKMAG